MESNNQGVKTMLGAGMQKRVGVVCNMTVGLGPE